MTFFNRLNPLIIAAVMVTVQYPYTITVAQDVQAIAKEITIPATFQQLEAYLKAEQWKEADAETWELMKKLTNSEERGWLRVEDYYNFPQEELRIIDQLWVKYSKGRFGFSVQKQIWLDVGGTVPAGEWDEILHFRFVERMGWIKNGEYLSYDQLIFGDTAPPGQFPACGGIIMRDYAASDLVFSYLFSKL